MNKTVIELLIAVGLTACSSLPKNQQTNTNSQAKRLHKRHFQVCKKFSRLMAVIQVKFQVMLQELNFQN